MAIRTNDSKAGFWSNLFRSRTRYQKGRFWGTVLVGLTLLMSLFSNVRSTEFSAEPVVYAVFPVFILFVSVHAVSYLNLKRKLSKILVWVGLGLVACVAFWMSGVHIFEQASRNGQPWYIALPYPFVVDFPSVIGMLILAIKDTAGQTVKKAETIEKAPVAAKATKAAVPAKTPAKRTTATKAAPRTRKTSPTITQESPIFRAAVVDDKADIEVNLNNAA